LLTPKDQFVSNKIKSKEPLLKLSRLVDNKEVWAYVFEFLSAESSDKAWQERDKATEFITKFMAQLKQQPQVTQIEQAPKVRETFFLKSTVKVEVPKTVPKAAPPVPVKEKQSLKLPDKDALQRANLLASNRELRSLHEQLVTSGVITDEEFWESRKVFAETIP
jgi:hypothetical protein